MSVSQYSTVQYSTVISEQCERDDDKYSTVL